MQVKDWGSGQPAELGSLEVEQDATRVFEAAGSSAGSSESGGGGASTTSQGMPFHETLARRLELLQSQGALGNLAQVRAAAAATAAAGTTAAACPPQFRRGAIPQVLLGHALGVSSSQVYATNFRIICSCREASRCRRLSSGPLRCSTMSR